MTENAENKTKLWLEFLLLSLVSLFLELLVIRWMSADIRAFSVFRTFPLVTCFIGLGAGYALGKDSLFRMTPWALLVTVATLKLAEVIGVSNMPFPSLSIFYWHDVASSSAELWLRVGAFMLVLIYLVMGPFGLMVCVGSRLGVLFNKLEPLGAYCVNIGGAILGSLLFTGLCFTGLHPWLLLAIPACIIFPFLNSGSRSQTIASAVAFALAIGAAAYEIPLAKGAVTYWSPYQRVDVVPMKFEVVDANTTAEKPLRSYEFGQQLLVNRIGYQQLTDWDCIKKNQITLPENILKDITVYAQRFELPFIVHPPGDVLIVGSGLGNDVAQALKNKATSVDAVEIDPVILRLGRELNPLKPYDSPIVHAHCNDARNFFRNCKSKYDTIDFSHLDSHVTTAGSSVRIDNYVYTKQSFAEAANLLKPNGLAVISYFSFKNWFTDRLYVTICDAIGYKPIQLFDKRSPFNLYFVFGPSVKDGTFKLSPEILQNFEVVERNSPVSARLLTDDWPYLYVMPGIVDIPYMLIVLEMLLFALYVGRKTIAKVTEATRWQMFFLGAAFLLLELQAISRLSLLYGATWLTSALVINGVLIMILLANILVIKIKPILAQKIPVVYVVLILSLLLSYFLPQEQILSMDLGFPGAANMLVTLVTLLPVFSAAIIFALSFAKSKNANEALAYNLYGAFCGAMLEYLSNYVGINNLVLVAMVLYILSFVCMPKKSAPDAMASTPADGSA